MKQTLIVFVQDEPGVLNRVSSHIRRKNFNIESIAAGHTEKKGITRITLVLNEPNKTKQSIVVNSLKQLIDVYDVIDATKIKSQTLKYSSYIHETKKLIGKEISFYHGEIIQYSQIKNVKDRAELTKLLKQTTYKLKE